MTLADERQEGTCVLGGAVKSQASAGEVVAVPGASCTGDFALARGDSRNRILVELTDALLSSLWLGSSGVFLPPSGSV
ncbi:hypothetical protein ACOMHN_018338 [Nucella lapillus]